MTKVRVTAECKTRFHHSPTWLVRSPGRVNLIGEHTDYNKGFVLPLAIDRAVWIAVQPRPDRIVEIHSLDFAATSHFDLDDLRVGPPGWIEYLKGMAWALQSAGYRLRGWQGVIAGDIPIGAGLSSSAALELAAARAFAAVSDLDWEPLAMARLAQQAENQWVGMNCGIMDQLTIAAGRAHHALLIDCRSLEIEAVPLPAGTVIAILDTATRRELLDSAYNERRTQCEAAARQLGVVTLRDISSGEFEQRVGELDVVLRRRAQHVASENLRTVQAAAAMRRNDATELGHLMNASHASLRDDFEVSSSALDAMVTAARAHPGCLGARMTGGGFGGCAVALVAVEQAAEFVPAVSQDYAQRTGLAATITLCRASDGVEARQLLPD